VQLILFRRLFRLPVTRRPRRVFAAPSARGVDAAPYHLSFYTLRSYD